MTTLAYSAACKATKESAREAGATTHMSYVPPTGFWPAPIRLVMVNLEPHGYGDAAIDAAEIHRWAFANASSRSKTTIRTIATAAAILSRLNGGPPATEAGMRALLANRPLLERTIEQIAYRNLRPTSNSNKPQDITEIRRAALRKVGACQAAEFAALEPHHVVVSGSVGALALGTIFQVKLPYRSRLPFGSMLLTSICHPSRVSYMEMAAGVERAVQPS